MPPLHLHIHVEWVDAMYRSASSFIYICWSGVSGCHSLNLHVRSRSPFFSCICLSLYKSALFLWYIYICERDMWNEWTPFTPLTYTRAVGGCHVSFCFILYIQVEWMDDIQSAFSSSLTFALFFSCISLYISGVSVCHPHPLFRCVSSLCLIVYIHVWSEWMPFTDRQQPERALPLAFLFYKQGERACLSAF